MDISPWWLVPVVAYLALVIPLAWVVGRRLRRNQPPGPDGQGRPPR